MAMSDLRADVESKKNKINKGRVGYDMIGGDRENLIKQPCLRRLCKCRG